MKRIALILAVLSALSMNIFSQEENNFGMHVEAGYAFSLPKGGNADFNYHGLNILAMPGYHVSDNLFVGVGVGLYDYQYNPTIVGGTMDVDFVSAPVFVHGLYSFPIEPKISPFVSLKIGYGIVSSKLNYTMEYPKAEWQMKASGGLYLSPSIGVLYSVNRSNKLSLGLSYDMQQYRLKKTVEAYGNDSDETNSAIAVKVGWFF